MNEVDINNNDFLLEDNLDRAWNFIDKNHEILDNEFAQEIFDLENLRKKFNTKLTNI